MKLIFALLLVVFSVSISVAQRNRLASSQEKTVLFQLISKNDDEIKQALSDGSKAASLKSTMSVEKKDLNNDGQPEYFVVIKDGGMCGAHANCPDWVYRKNGAQYQLLLRTFGQELTLEKQATNGFADLRSLGSDSATEGSFTIYKFNGDKYRADSCFTRIYGTGKKKDRIVPQKCDANQ